MKFNKLNLILNLPVILFILILSGRVHNPQAATKGTKHDFGCKACHDIHYPKGRALWATPLSRMNSGKVPLTSSDAMCYSCHKAEEKGGKFFLPGHSHPINVVPSADTKIPKKLGTTYVEGVGRVITCVSCHDPHSSNPKFLKIKNDQDALCKACHVSY